MTTTTTTTTTVSGTESFSPTKANGSGLVLQQNGGGVKMVAKGNVVLVEDFCCASPKRKEYKIDELLIQNGGYTLGGADSGSPTKTRMALRGTQNSQPITNGGGGGGGVAAAAAVVVTNGSVTTNGRLCPMAGNEITRFLLSQSKSKSRKARKKSPNFELVNDDTCDSFATSLQEQASPTLNGHANGVVKMEADDENEEPVSGEGDVHPFQMFGRMPIGNGMVAEENIFLQEPVLKLNVDEAARVLVHPKSEGEEGEEEEEEGRPKRGIHKGTSAAAVALINQDSNSGDSGVVIDKLQEGAAQNGTPKPLLNVSRPRVPTTPHRILCPSSPQLNGGGAVKYEEGIAVEGEGNADEELEDPQETKRK